MFNRQIIFIKPDGTKWQKLCNEKDVKNWIYLFKTYNWNVLEIIEINDIRQ